MAFVVVVVVVFSSGHGSHNYETPICHIIYVFILQGSEFLFVSEAYKMEDATAPTTGPILSNQYYVASGFRTTITQ